MSGNLCSEYNNIKFEYFVVFCYDVLCMYLLDFVWLSWLFGCIGIFLSLIFKLLSV